jgi:hypothetical protein
MTDTPMHDPDQVETDIAGGDFAEAGEEAQDERVDFDEGDTDYEDENRLDD